MKPITSKQIWKFGGLVAADGLMFGLTSPQNVPSFGLMAGFLLLVATLYYLVNGLLLFARLYGLSVRRRRHLAFVITGLLGSLAALQSIGELNLLDVLVAAPLVIITYVYSSYARNSYKRNSYARDYGRSTAVPAAPAAVLSDPPPSGY